MSSNNQGTEKQSARLSILNDRHGVERWKLRRDGVLVVTCDDGDVAEVDSEGYVTWKSAS